jgi:hypothetical protein
MHDSVALQIKRMSDSVALLRADIASLRSEIIRSTVWTVLGGAALIGVLAHGFKWL